MDEKSRQALLSIAHDSLQSYLTGDESKIAQLRHYPDLQRRAGAFVSIYADGELRGCVGHITADQPLIQVIRRMTTIAASEDYRFSPIQPEELPKVAIEISVLSELLPMDDIADVQIGLHGLLVRAGQNQGILLPQVASRFQWSAEEFLRQTCRKAMLPEKAYEEAGTEVYKFTAEIIKEKHISS